MANENFVVDKRVKQNSGVYIFFLILSFVWLEIYPTISSTMYSLDVGFGDALSKDNLSVLIVNVITDALINWGLFELLFWVYRYVLSFKIYSFVVPMESLKAETRIYFIIRNIILGVLYNLCFLFPYLYIYAMFFNLVVTMVILLLYAKHLNSVYSESIVGHFVFKNFCYPIFIYEGIDVLYYLCMVIL